MKFWLTFITIMLLASIAFAGGNQNETPHPGIGFCASGKVVNGLIPNAPPSCVVAATGSGTVSNGTTNQAACYPSNGTTVEGCGLSTIGALAASNNLSDVASAATSRSNLNAAEIGNCSAGDFVTALATGSAPTCAVALIPSNNLSDVSSASTARTNLGLGTAATQNTGTSGGNIPLLNANNTYSGTSTFTGAVAVPTATASPEPLQYGQTNASLENLLPNNDQTAQHSLGSPQGAQFSQAGAFNVNDPYWSSSCPADTSTVSETCWQAAYEAACTAAGAATNNIQPWVYVPSYNNYTFKNHGILMDCAYQIPIIGDRSVAFNGPGTRINASGNFPVIQSTTPATRTALGSLNTTNIATGGVANTAHLWSLASGGGGQAGQYGYDISSVLAKSLGPTPLNGKGALGIQFYFNAPYADSDDHSLFTAFDTFNDFDSNIALDSKFNNTTISFGVSTGSSISYATGTISTATNEFVEFDYDGANQCVYVGTPGGATTRGSDVALTGNIVQKPVSPIEMGMGLPSLRFGMQGVLDSVKIDTAAFHTCASTSTFTAPTAKLTTDGNTIFLDTGTDSTSTLTYANMSTCGTSGTAGCFSWPVSYSGGATNSQMRPIPVSSAVDNQGNPTYVANLQLVGGNESIVNDEHPRASTSHVEMCPSYAGIVNVDNNFEGDNDDDTMDLYDCGYASSGSIYGYWDFDPQSFAYNHRMVFYDGGVNTYAGHSSCYECEFDPAGATVNPIIIAGSNTSGGNVSLTDPLWDNENSFSGDQAITWYGGVSGLSLVGGYFNMTSNEPVIDLLGAVAGGKMTIIDSVFPASGVPPITYGALSHSTIPFFVNANNVTAAVDATGNSPLTGGQLCSANQQYCIGIGANISNSPMVGQGLVLATTATTDYMFAQGGPLAVSGTEATFETKVNRAQTITTLNCITTSAQGSGNQDLFTYIDVTNACSTAPTDTLLNSTTGTSQTIGLCNIQANDLVVISDVTTGTALSARSGYCTAS